MKKTAKELKTAGTRTLLSKLKEPLTTVRSQTSINKEDGSIYSQTHILHELPIIAPEVQSVDVTNEMVHYAFLLNLPYRLRLGSLYRQSVKFPGRTLELVIRNKILVSPDSGHEDVISQPRQTEQLSTQAMVIRSRPRIDGEKLNAMRRRPSGSRQPPLSIPQVPILKQ